MAILQNWLNRLWHCVRKRGRSASLWSPCQHQIGDLRVSCASQYPQDSEFDKAWLELLAAHPDGCAFQDPAWQRAVQRFFVGDNLRLLTVHRGQRLLGLLPLNLTPGGTLESAGAGVSDYLDPLVDPAHAAASWEAMLALLSQRWGRTPSLILRNVPAHSLSRKLLPELAPRHGFVVQEAAPQVVLQIDLPETMEQYFARLKRDDRTERRRRLRKAENEAQARIVDCASSDQLSGCLESVLGLMETAPGEKGQAVRQYLRPLLMAAGPELCARGRLSLVTLMLNGNLAGGLIVLPSSHGPMMYNGGFDQAQRGWAPGIVGNLMVLREAIGRGQKVFDLLRGQEPYKYDLGAVERPLYELTLQKQ